MLPIISIKQQSICN